MDKKVFMSVKEACERYSVGRTTLYSLFQMQDCPPIRKLGGKTLIEVGPFDEFFRAQLQQSVIEKNKSF